MSDSTAPPTFSQFMSKEAGIVIGVAAIFTLVISVIVSYCSIRIGANAERLRYAEEMRLRQQQKQHEQQEHVHECKLLDVEQRALKEFRLRLMQKPGEMVPIFNPRFNARMIVIELILLQHHLEYPGMLCKECIARKHMLAIEGYALEAIGLVKVEATQDPDMVQLVQDMNEVARMMRDLQKLFIENPQKNALEIARVVRALRKELSVKYGILPV